LAALLLNAREALDQLLPGRLESEGRTTADVLARLGVPTASKPGMDDKRLVAMSGGQDSRCHKPLTDFDLAPLQSDVPEAQLEGG